MIARIPVGSLILPPAGSSKPTGAKKSYPAEPQVARRGHYSLLDGLLGKGGQPVVYELLDRYFFKFGDAKHVFPPCYAQRTMCPSASVRFTSMTRWFLLPFQCSCVLRSA